jgi:uncharacterized Ntn-hydrolase superfamily protein
VKTTTEGVGFRLKTLLFLYDLTLLLLDNSVFLYIVILISRMRTTLLLAFFFLFSSASAQDTFSIVAIDTVTKEIGSAGATCLTEQAGFPGAIFISDIIGGHGAIHTQSYGLVENQLAARERMLAGDSPEEIIVWLIENDYTGYPESRQYGIVDLDANGSPRTAAYTGEECMDYKNHIIGRNYAIQGNILLGQQILDSMEARFLRTNGTLADKLMGCLQGANVPGADSRCLSDGLSSKSSFLRVSRWEDPDKTYKLNLNVPKTVGGRDPIDSLQTLFDIWKTTSSVKADDYTNQKVRMYYDLSTGNISLDLSLLSSAEAALIKVYDISGKHLRSYETKSEQFTLEKAHFIQGTYVIVVSQGESIFYTGKITF